MGQGQPPCERPLLPDTSCQDGAGLGSRTGLVGAHISNISWLIFYSHEMLPTYHLDGLHRARHQDHSRMSLYSSSITDCFRIAAVVDGSVQRCKGNCQYQKDGPLICRTCIAFVQSCHRSEDFGLGYECIKRKIMINVVLYKRGNGLSRW